jgi:ligand-binding sensor domain-containing protein
MRAKTITAFLLSIGIFSANAQWKQVKNGIGDIPVKSIVSYNKLLVAGTEGEGVFVSADSGKSWKQMNMGLVEPTKKSASANVNFLFSGGRNLFAATGNGIFVSADNSKSWIAKNSGPLKGLHVTTLFAEGSTIYAGTQKGIFISTNEGTDWVESNTGLLNKEILCFMKDGSDLYAGTYQGIYKKTADNSWQALNSDVTHQINGMEKIDTILFAATGSGVYAVTNNGKDWNEKLKFGLPEYNNVTFLKNVNNSLYCGVETAVYRLDGDYWNEVSTSYPCELTGYPGNGGAHSAASVGSEIFLATSIGIFYNYTDQSYKKGIGFLQNAGTDVTKLSYMAPEEGDHVLLIRNNISNGNYLFKNSRNVYYDYNFESKIAIGPNTFDQANIDALFLAVDRTLSTHKPSIPVNGDITGYEELFKRTERFKE